MSEFNIEITEISPVERNVKCSVEERWVNERCKVMFDELSQNVTVKGFRSGKAPRKVIERMYKSRVTKDVIEDIARDGYRKAIEDNDLNPVAMPEFNNPAYKGSGDYEFSFVIEIRPEIKEVKLDEINVEKERLVVKDEAVDEEIETRRQNAASMKTVEGRDIVAKDDWVKVDYEGFMDDKAIDGGKAENQLVDLSESKFVPGFEQNLVDKKMGEEFEFTVTFPDDFRVEDMKSKEISFKCTVNEILTKEVPKLDDEFAKDMGEYEDLSQFRIAVREELEENAKKRIEYMFKEALWKKVVEANPMPLPPTLVQEQIKLTKEQQAAEWMKHGMDPKAMGISDEDLEARAKEEAKFTLYSIFLEDKLSRDYEIKVTDEDIEGQFAEMAASMNFPIEQIKAYYGGEDKVESLRYSLRHDKMIEALANKVNVVEVDPKEPEVANNEAAKEETKEEAKEEKSE